MSKDIDIITHLRDILKEEHLESLDIFNIFKYIGTMINNPNYKDREKDIQELILRSLDKRDQVAEYEELLDALARQMGLFPYLKEENLRLPDIIAYEYHRPIGLENIVFHKVQAEVYRDLLSGQSVILSAPTSFGKSIIIDAIINLNKFKNILILVPTIALIDETRRRLSAYRYIYKIVTHPKQKLEDKNIFVLTQERVLELSSEIKPDFIVIDEFYKITPSGEDDERSISLNQALYKLFQSNAQFYLLGPNIERISPDIEYISKIKSELEFKFKRTDYKTVVTEYHHISSDYNTRIQKLIGLTENLDEQTLIYCKSPNSVNSVVQEMIKSNKFQNLNELDEAVHWMKDNYHESWLFAEALNKGIGIHHGKIPRSISQFCVRSFNNNRIKYLVCTSTLIEGVNTSAKNVIIFDNKIAKKQIDYFTFNNIAGRSGRMFKHFIGNVYLFHEPPESDLPTVEFPLFTQRENVPERLLMQIDDQDLNEKSKGRVNIYKNQEILSFDTLRANSIAEPSYQIDLAKLIMSDITYYYSKLHWTNVPNYEQLDIMCEIIWDYLVRSRWSGGIRSGSELAIWLKKLMKFKDIKTLIESETTNYADPLHINNRIEDTLEFLRNWAMYKFPRMLLVVDSIQKEIFVRENLNPGDYLEFASMIENLFLDSTLIALDEYGIPTQISKKLTPWIKPDGDLDGVIQRLKEIDVNRVSLSNFEKELVNDALKYL